MDFHCLEALLGLPEFRVIAQVCGPQQLDLHLQRRDEHIVCPRCQACCSRVKESRPRCIRDLPILEHPVMLWLHMRRFQCADCRHRPWETSERLSGNKAFIREDLMSCAGQGSEQTYWIIGLLLCF